jgi:YVTN family beta-propeller protein
MMEFRILGPLDVRESERAIHVAGGKQRALLAVLLLRPGESVSIDRLIDALWGARAPASAPSSIHAYVSRLRKVLGRERVLREAHGYRLVVEPGELDLTRFQRLFASGSERLAQGDADGAADQLRRALALWHGPPLADLTYEPFAADEIARLEELRLQALEERIEADLALGRHQQLVPELDTLVREHPLRERLRGQQMLALYRSGRQADALEAYRQARSALVAELGLEPGPALQQLERQILTHDSALEAPGAARPPVAGMRRRRAALLAALIVLVLVAVAIVITLTPSNESPIEITASNESPIEITVTRSNESPKRVDAVGVIDSSLNRLVARIPVGIHPVGIAYHGGDVWVANTESDTVSSIDPQSRRVRTIGIGEPPTDIVFAGGNVWTGNGRDGTLSEISRVLGEERGKIDLIGEHPLFRTSVIALAAGADSLWAATSKGDVLRIDPRTRRILESWYLARTPLAIGFGAGAAWVVTDDNHLLRIEPSGGRISGDKLVGFSLSRSIAATGDSVFVGVQPSDSAQVVEMLDANSMQPKWSAPVRAPVAIAVGGDAVWVASGEGKVFRLDPASGRVIHTIPVGGVPSGLVVVGDEVWVTIDESQD